MATCGRQGQQLESSAWEFERHAQDVGMAKEDAKVHLVLALNQDTLTCLDAYVTMRGGDKMAHLETIQDWLCLHPLHPDVSILEVGELSELAR